MTGEAAARMAPDAVAYVLTGIDAAMAATARQLAAAGASFVILDRPGGPGRALVLELNTGSRGRAVYLPGNPDAPFDRSLALTECARCWPQQVPILIHRP